MMIDQTKTRKLKAFAALCLTAGLLALFSCAPKAAQGDDSFQAEPSSEQSDTIDFEWSEEADCSLCHSIEADSTTDSSCLASIHTQEGNTCVTCHADGDGMKAVHEGASAEAVKERKGLRKTKVDAALCVSCHGDCSELAQSTAASTVLTDSKGTVVNPHAMPDIPDHADATCTSCHRMHDPAEAAESAQKYCASCHHEDVYECYTCHD